MQPPPTDGEASKPAAPAPSPLSIDGVPLRSAEEVARFLSVPYGRMIYTLYKSPDKARYRGFEIPKRSGGMRLIQSPNGLLREMQEKLGPVLQAAYEAHPAAHGFIKTRSVVSNARLHVAQRLVLNIDLEDFFPNVNFGRVRGIFMAPPFSCAPAAASVLAQICTHRNGLPQGAPTSPALSNLASATLDRRLTRLAKENGLRYSRYADDITFSSNHSQFPPAVAIFTEDGKKGLAVRPGEALERAIAAAGFSINLRKVRLQPRHVRQAVTGLTVNAAPNVERKRIRRVRAMLHAWAKFGAEAAGAEHLLKYRGAHSPGEQSARAFRNALYGELAYIKMVRGQEDRIFLNLCAKVLELDPNPSRFIRQMVFGADDYDVFISHASEDKDEIARPIFEACGRAGLKAFLDEAHIGWGQSFTQKINSALGAARTVLVIVSSTSVSKDWPVLEVNTALQFEAAGQKKVVPVIVGKPDLSRLPLLSGKDGMVWSGDADAVATRLQAAVKGDAPRRPERGAAKPPARAAPPQPPPRAAGRPGRTAVPVTAPRGPRRGFWSWLFGARPR
ncbi:MAG: TIR domain-containing protein [Hyphomonadaceae bacterium]|nr:TIR domain-containing protein [Hyphomonadaceae bacterium]